MGWTICNFLDYFYGLDGLFPPEHVIILQIQMFSFLTKLNFLHHNNNLLDSNLAKNVFGTDIVNLKKIRAEASRSTHKFCLAKLIDHTSYISDNFKRTIKAGHTLELAGLGLFCCYYYCFINHICNIIL